MAGDIFIARDGNGALVPVLADLVTDATIGSGIAQFTKIMDGTIDGTNKAIVDSTGALKVNQRISTTAVQTNVADVTTSAPLLSANPSRLGATFFNDSTSACYISLSGAATYTNFAMKLAPAGAWELPVPGFTGAITCIWDTDTASGAMRVTELT